MKKSITIAAIITALMVSAICFGAVELKQSTAVTVKIGPFIDIVDGTTRKTGLTITQGSVWLSKAGGHTAVKSEASSCGPDGTLLGIYDCNLNTTDTGTLGPLRIDVNDINAVPLWAEFEVVDANYYNNKYAGTNTGVILAANGFDNLKDPNTDPNSWTKTQYAVANFYRWFCLSSLDHSINSFVTYDPNGNALVKQPVAEANNIETIYKAQTP
jgi:hypothetical protein